MLGYMLLVLAAICLFVSRSPQQIAQNMEASADIPSTTWTQAMMSPTFWLFALSSALFQLGLVRMVLQRRCAQGSRLYSRSSSYCIGYLYDGHAAQQRLGGLAFHTLVAE